jgi:potassium efflux system protein
MMHRPKRLSWLSVVLAVTIFLSLAIAALAGFLYSAVEITGRVNQTLWIALGLLIVHQLVSRWLLIVQQRLLLRAALERLEAARKEREKELEEASEDVAITIEEPEVDIASIDADTRMLLKTGLLLTGFLLLGTIWSSVLPAFSFLEEYTLGSYVTGPVGEQTLVPRTLADALLTLLIAFLTYVGARSLPSLLEVVLRQGASSTAGSRLAYATLLRYVIVIAGVAAVSSTIGFQWNKLQWLVAAMGVGIGFGLQEIVANFISGLIILLERPIRVGDIVTVGDVSGTVTRLHIRATTVTNWDRQELLVPNKEFITNRVLNWSLTDEVIRLVMQVGVEYGSDLDESMRLIREAVEEHERVLIEPKPLITFDEFGDNSLNITARAFIASLGNRRETVSDINLAINRKLNEAGIVIAFPQRDIHFDSDASFKIQIQPEEPKDAS